MIFQFQLQSKKQNIVVDLVAAVILLESGGNIFQTCCRPEEKKLQLK
jgi:hypothetical protein